MNGVRDPKIHVDIVVGVFFVQAEIIRIGVKEVKRFHKQPQVVSRFKIDAERGEYIRRRSLLIPLYTDIVTQ